MGFKIEYTYNYSTDRYVSTGDCSDHNNVLSHKGELRSTVSYGKAVGYGDVNCNGSGQFRQVY
jgi:hypothetical protein